MSVKPLTDKLVIIILFLVGLPFFFIYVAIGHTRYLLFEQKKLPDSLKSKILQLYPGDEIIYNDVATKIIKRAEMGFSLYFSDLILSEAEGYFSLVRNTASEEFPERVEPYTQSEWKIKAEHDKIIVTVKHNV